jgi:hypothetical protein
VCGAGQDVDARCEGHKNFTALHFAAERGREARLVTSSPVMRCMRLLVRLDSVEGWTDPLAAHFWGPECG